MRAIYYLYEWWLLRQIRQQPLPRHVGIILDSNRRFGRGVGVTDPRVIYGLGAKKLDDVKGGAILAQVRAIGEAFNTGLAYCDVSQKIVYENYMTVRCNHDEADACADRGGGSSCRTFLVEGDRVDPCR